MNKGLIANVSTTIDAPSADVWPALVTPVRNQWRRLRDRCRMPEEFDRGD